MKRMIALILALVFCLVGYGEEREADDSPASNAQGDNVMEAIWNLTDQNEFIIAMADHLAEKTQYGEDMSVLSEAERVFYITQLLEMEVNNGGFSQFFYNSGGDFSGELVSAFIAIGADKTAAICQKAIDAFGCDIPADRDERIELLENDQIDEIFAACDDAFYAYEENLNELNYTFVMQNKEHFT